MEHKIQMCGQNAQLLGALEKLRKATVGFVICVHPHRTTRLSLGELPGNFTFEDFSTVYRDNSNVTEITHE